MSDTRVEKDSLGEIEVPVEARWGAQTQRAVNNFPISGRGLPARFIQAVVRIKRCAAQTNADLELLDDHLGVFQRHGRRGFVRHTHCQHVLRPKRFRSQGTGQRRIDPAR